MRAVVRNLLVAVVLLTCFGAPIAEAVDSWDHTLQDGNDTEANLVIAVVCAGIALTLTTVLVRRLRALSAAPSDPVLPARVCWGNPPLCLHFVSVSPPPTLRI